MLKPGDVVTIRKQGCDECFPTWAAGKRGVVVRLVTEGCGASPRDPMYVVRLDDGREAEVWTEEVE